MNSSNRHVGAMILVAVVIIGIAIAAISISTHNDVTVKPGKTKTR